MAISRTALFLGLSALIAAPLAPREIAPFFDRLAVETEVEALAGRVPGLAIQAVHATPAQRLLDLDGLSLHQQDLRLRIGHLHLHWSRPQGIFAKRGFIAAIAAEAAPATGTVTADDVTIDTATLHAVIKHLELSGTSLSKADLTALLDPHSTVPAVARIAQVSAAHVAIAEMQIEDKPPAGGQEGGAAPAKGTKITLTGVSLDDVVKGQAAHAAVTAISAITQMRDAGETQSAFGPMRLEKLDLVQLAEALAAIPDSTEAKAPLCESLAIDGVKFTVPQTKADFGVATMTVKDMRRLPFANPPKEAGTQPDKSAAPATVSLADRIALGSVDFTDMRFHASNGSTSWSGRIGHGVMNKVVADKVGAAQFEDFTVVGEGATVKISRLGWHGTAQAAEAAGAPPHASAGDQQNLVADTLDIDLTNLAPAQAPAGTPTHFELGRFTLTSQAPADGGATLLAANFDHFTCDLSGLKDGEFAQIAALGYSKLDLSSRLEAHYDAGRREFDLSALSLSGTDMGAIRMSGRFDQVTKGLLSSDEADLEAALVRVLLHRLDLKVDNAGLFERLVAAAAKAEGVTPAEIRKRFTETVTNVVPALLNNGRGADQIAAALAKFIANPKTFHLSVSAPDGVGALDAILIKDPAVLMDRLEIKATADE